MSLFEKSYRLCGAKHKHMLLLKALTIVYERLWPLMYNTQDIVFLMMQKGKKWVYIVICKYLMYNKQK